VFRKELYNGIPNVTVVPTVPDVTRQTATFEIQQQQQQQQQLSGFSPQANYTKRPPLVGTILNNF
jgi:hypothetical protein